MRDRSKSKKSIEQETITDGKQEISNFRAALPQILAVSVKNILLLGYGMTLGFPTIVIPAIQGGEGRDPSVHNEFVLNKDQISWFSSINLMCVPLGSIFSGAFTQPIGRKRAMQIINIPFLGAWLCFYFSSNIYHLYAGLCLAGISGGLLEAPVLTYVAEVTEPRFRGMLASTGATCALIGILLQFVMGTFLPWRTIALCNCCVPVISLISLIFVPESPHWLIMKQRFDESKKNLQWLRGWVPFVKVEEEYNGLYKSLGQQAEINRNTTWVTKAQLYTKSSFLIPYGIISYTFFIAHFCGMTTLQTYAVQIFHTLKAPIDKYYATMLLGVAELAGTFTCVILVHFTGKRPLVFFSTIGCGLCFLGTATYAYFLDSVPGNAVSNIVSNASYLNQDPYVHDLFMNSTHLELNLNNKNNIEQNLTDFDYDTKISNYNNYNNNNNTNGTIDYDFDNLFDSNNNDTKFYFDNLDFSLLSLNDTINDEYYDINNITIDKDINSDVSVIPKDIFVPIISKTIENKYVWVPMTLLIGSAYLSHSAIKLIPWLLIGELYPPNVRSGAAGFSGGTGYIFGFLSNKLFLTMIASLTLPGTFWFYSCISLSGALILYFILPETEGKTLMEIEENLKRKKKQNFNEENPEPITELPYTRNPDRIKKQSIQNKTNHQLTEMLTLAIQQPQQQILQNQSVLPQSQNFNNITKIIENSPKKQKQQLQQEKPITPINLSKQKQENTTNDDNTNQVTTNNNFDVKNLENNLLFQRNLEQIKNLKNNNTEMDTIHEMDVPIETTKMGIKKNKINNKSTKQNQIKGENITNTPTTTINNQDKINIKNDNDDEQDVYNTSL